MFYLILFVSISVAEVYLFIKVGQVIGPMNTIIIIAVTAILGVILARLEGFALVNKAKEELEENKEMTNTILDCIFVFLGALFLVLPGFITDIFGIMFIIPLTRAYFRNRVSPGFRKRIEDVVEKKKKEMIEKGKLKRG